MFVPAYRCATQIVRVLDQFRDPAVHNRFAEILVLDNVSPDATAEAALVHAQRLGIRTLRIAQNRENYGLGGSHKSAFAYAEAAGFTHVVVFHGDDQGSIRDLIPILERGDHHRHEACLGSRFMRGARTEGYSRFRLFGNHVFNLIFTIATAYRVRDLGSGLNMFSRSVFTDPSVRMCSDDLRFNVDLLLDLIDKRRSMLFFPISWREKDQVSNVRMMSLAFKTLRIGLEYAFARRAFLTRPYRQSARSRYSFDFLPRSDTPMT